MVDKTTIWAVAQIINPVQIILLCDFKQTTLQRTNIKGIVNGIIDLVMHVPSGIGVG